MHVLIVGAGWYGCYAAMLLDQKGIPFHIIDKSDNFFAGSSSMNQNRLHLGFHYPRSYRTRVECQSGFMQFRDTFPSNFTVSIPNIYAISKHSCMDHPTFCHIYQHEGVPFAPLSTEAWDTLSQMALNTLALDGSLLSVGEQYIDFHKAKAYFKERLEQHRIPFDASALIVSSDASQVTYKGVSYTHVLDCTYGQWRTWVSNSTLKMHYEVCCTLLYKENASALAYPAGPTAFTVMDGPFFSLYPYDIQRRIYTLTHPVHTPLQSFTTSAEAVSFLEHVASSKNPDSGPEQDGHPVHRARHAMEKDVLAVLPDFRTHFEYTGYYLSIKAKFDEGGCDDRSVRVHREGIIWSFVGGKITGIFALDTLLDSILLGRNDIKHRTDLDIEDTSSNK